MKKFGTFEEIKNMVGHILTNDIATLFPFPVHISIIIKAKGQKLSPMVITTVGSLEAVSDQLMEAINDPKVEHLAPDSEKES